MSKRLAQSIIALVIILAAVSAAGAQGAPEEGIEQPAVNSAGNRADIQRQLENKNQELEQINKKIQETQEQLKETQGERKNLQRELNTLQQNITQLNLNIKADDITIKKLALEIENLNIDLADIKTSTEDKKAAIAEVLRELQKNDEATLLTIFLKNDTLADGLLETQTLYNLQSRLAVDIANLRKLHEAYNGKIKETDERKTAIGFHQKNLQNRKFIVEDQKTERETILKQTKNKENLYQKQVEELKKQQQEIADEVETLDALLRSEIDPGTLPPLKGGVLGMPVAGGRELLTQDYGATSFAQYGYRGKWHNGVDFRAPLGTPIFASEDGVVAAAGNQDSYCPRGAYGKYVVINHNNNLTTLYAHLSRYIVSKGDRVTRGQLIGYSGRTGYATGPHLHFTVFAQPTFRMGGSRVCGPMPHGGDLNPLGYL
jgi:murein DD-endopeptidase MepM/ murein hydrolase activator NlpD